MQNEEMNLSKELEQMKLEYDSLKTRLEKQEIINEELILASIRKDLRLVNAKRIISLAGGSLALVLVSIVAKDLGLSVAFVLASVAFIVYMVASNFIRNGNMSVDALRGEPIRRFLEKVKIRKQNQFRWFRINLCLFILWVGAFVGSCFKAGLEKESLVPVIIGIGVGALIGLVCGFKVHNKIIGIYEGIILELEKDHE